MALDEARSPAWPDRLIADLAANDRHAIDIARGLSAEEINWKPAPDAWSIGQCLDHLAVINVVYLKALGTGVDLAKARGWRRRGPSVPGFFGGMFARSMEPPVKRRLFAPSGTQPSPRRDRAAVLRAYHDAHDDFRRMLDECADLDTNRATFQNPFITWVRVKVSSGLRVIPAHDRRHLWQAERVREAQGFPKV